jgi:hypothetical protein
MLTILLIAGLVQAIQAAICLHDSATGSWTHIDADLEQGRVHVLLAQQGVLLPLADCVCHLQRDFAQRFASAGFVI